MTGKKSSATCWNVYSR